MTSRTPSRSLFTAVAAFEWRQQVRSQAFVVVFAISTALVAGASVLPQLRVAGGGGPGGAAAVLRLDLLWSLFFLFTATAFAADAVLRDEATRFAPLIATSGVRRLDHLLGRFAGAYAATALCFLSVPLGSALGALATGPLAVGGWAGLARAHLEGLLILALPNLFMSCAVFFSLATLARSMKAAYLGAVAVLTLYGLGHGFDAAPSGWGAALAEPFGFAALAQGSLAGAPMVSNRLAWGAVGVAALALTCGVYRFEPPARTRARPARADRAPRRDLEAPAPTPRFNARTPWSQGWARTRLECGQVARSPTFALLMLMGSASAVAALARVSPPDAPRLIARMIESVRLVPTVVVLFYAGELMWNEREHRVDALIAATPISRAALLFSKVVALALVLVAMALATALTAVIVQVVRAPGRPLAWSAYLAWYVWPRSYDWLLPIAPAVAFQAVSPDKLAGWGWMVLFLLASLAMEALGWRGGLYRFGGRLDGSLAATVGPDAIAHAGLLRAYWAAVAVLLLTAAHLLWDRGLGGPLRARFGAARRRLRAAPLLVAGAATAVALACGAALWR